MRGSLLRLWLLVAAVAAGAVAGSFQWLEASSGIACVAVAGGAAALRRIPPAAFVAIALFGLGCGIASAGSRASDGASLESLASQVPRCEVHGRVLETLGGLGTLIAIESARCADVEVDVDGAAAADLDAAAGSSLTASGWLLPLGDDRYANARRRAGARAELRIDESDVRPPSGAFAAAARVRLGLVAATAAISDREAGLFRGLTIGDTDGISRATLDAFRRSGLSHLLAVSGSNVAIVLAGVAWGAARLSLHTRIAVCAAALALFVLVVGPDGSVLRAAAMGGIGLVALLSGRQAEPLHALGVALAVLVAVRPAAVFSLGLHLSVGATAGIILWSARLNARMGRVPNLLSLPLSVTLAAQAGVLPLLAIVFGQVSLIAPAANVAAAPAVAPATVLAFIGGLAAIAHEGLGGAILRLAEPFASWILYVGDVAARPAWAALDVPSWLAWTSAVGVAIAVLRSLRIYGRPITLGR